VLIMASFRHWSVEWDVESESRFIFVCVVGQLWIFVSVSVFSGELRATLCLLWLLAMCGLAMLNGWSIGLSGLIRLVWVRGACVAWGVGSFAGLCVRQVSAWWVQVNGLFLLVFWLVQYCFFVCVWGGGGV